MIRPFGLNIRTPPITVIKHWDSSNRAFKFMTPITQRFRDPTNYGKWNKLHIKTFQEALCLYFGDFSFKIQVQAWHLKTEK